MKNRDLSFRVYSTGLSQGEGRFECFGGFYLDELLRKAQQQRGSDVTHEITITKKQAYKGMEKDLKRKVKNYELRFHRIFNNGTLIKLKNARHVTDGIPVDTILKVNIK